MPSSEIETCEVLDPLFTTEIDGTVDIVQEGCSCFEDLQNIVCQIRGEDEVVVQVHDQAEVLQFEEVSVRAVGRVPIRDFLQGTVRVEFQTGSDALENHPEIPAAKLDVLSQDLQHPGLGEVVPDGEEVIAAAVDVKVISAVSGFLPATVDEDSHVRLVRALVLGEAHVPVNPVGAVRYRQGTDARVKGTDSFNQFYGQLTDRGLRLQVVCLMGLEPDLVVVQGKGMEES